MSLLERAPKLAAADAIRVARTLYGLEGSAEPLPSERDQNFLLHTGGGRFVLKLANGLEPRDVLEAQNAALVHVAAAVDFCPRVVATVDGELIGREPSGHFVRLVTWLPGVPLGNMKHHSRALLEHLGSRVGMLGNALRNFDHPALHREFHWDLAHAFTTIARALPGVRDARWRGVLEREAESLHARLAPVTGSLRRSIVHNDVNDYNVLVRRDLGARPHDFVSGVIDFGDMVYSYEVSDLAVAIAYAVLKKTDPLEAGAHVVRGYHRKRPLASDELAVLFDLVKLRLCLSAALAAEQQQQRPDDDYLGISQAPIRQTLPRLMAIHPRFAETAWRQACGLPASPKSDRVVAWLKGGSKGGAVPISGRMSAIDLSVGSPLIAVQTAGFGDPGLNGRINRAMPAADATVAVGGYLEARLYNGPLFRGLEQHDGGGERRTIHLAVDFFAPAGTPVHAALDGCVHAFADNRQPGDYGPLVILEHQTGDGDDFFTLYGHLSRESLAPLTNGAPLRAGDIIGTLGTSDVNGGWAPHLHFQVITDLLEMGCDFPGVSRPAEADTWAVFSPDPNLLLKLPESLLSQRESDPSSSLAARRTRTGANVRVAYREPLKIVRGWMQYLYDERGRRYLDAYNNVPHVGHGHPRIVQAAADQWAVLNTNTRYLHDALERFAFELTATLPRALTVCYFVSSGSEANELALRLARTHTARQDVIVLEGAYHGITSTLIDISPYKFEGPGGAGKPAWVHVAPLPDVYRGIHCGRAEAGRAYAGDVQALVERIRSSGRGVAAFIAESAPSAAGQMLLPPDYLAHVYASVRSAGGVCIADEVQTAYGRIGSHFYAFEAHGVSPDIVVLGKPIGNGYPIGAVVTTPEIAASFDNGMEFFSTFGGSTVSCAVGRAVLDVVKREKLQEHAREVGALLLEGLRQLGRRHAVIGDVRGSGFFVGVELVADRDSRIPAAAAADYVVNRLREEGILIGTDGLAHNVLKIRPPMPFNQEDAQRLVDTLDRVLEELEPRNNTERTE